MTHANGSALTVMSRTQNREGQLTWAGNYRGRCYSKMDKMSNGRVRMCRGRGGTQILVLQGSNSYSTVESKAEPNRRLQEQHKKRGKNTHGLATQRHKHDTKLV